MVLTGLVSSAIAKEPDPKVTDQPVTKEGSPAPGSDDPSAEDAKKGNAAKKAALPEGYLRFERACEAGEQMTIAAVGDLLIHRELQRQAWKEPDRFISLWRGVKDLIARADVSYANLEGPTAYGLNRRGAEVKDPGEKFDDVVYTGYARFNYHPKMIEDLVKTGFDVVSTANNHSLDRQSLGADRTIEALERERLKFTGTRRASETEKSRPWYTITRQGGVKIAWLACTYSTNQIEDVHGQVLFCFEEPKRVIDLIRKLSKRKDIDAVIVTPHWGKQYKHTPATRQIKYAHKYLEAGALAVIGNHPHVVQPWERYVTRDGRETFVIYSIGNFSSHQQDLPRRSTLLLYLGLTKNKAGDVFINGVRYMPLHTRHDKPRDFYFTEAIDRVGGWAEPRALIMSLLGPYNVLPPDAPLVTNPHCDPSWKAPTR